MPWTAWCALSRRNCILSSASVTWQKRILFYHGMGTMEYMWRKIHMYSYIYCVRMIWTTYSYKYIYWHCVLSEEIVGGNACWATAAHITQCECDGRWVSLRPVRAVRIVVCQFARPLSRGERRLGSGTRVLLFTTVAVSQTTLCRSTLIGALKTWMGNTVGRKCDGLGFGYTFGFYTNKQTKKLKKKIENYIALSVSGTPFAFGVCR